MRKEVALAVGSEEVIASLHIEQRRVDGERTDQKTSAVAPLYVIGHSSSAFVLNSGSSPIVGPSD